MQGDDRPGLQRVFLGNLSGSGEVSGSDRGPGDGVPRGTGRPGPYQPGAMGSTQPCRAT